MRWAAAVGLIACFILNITSTSDAAPLTVHIIGHSHCDPGWLETFEGYYINRVKKILTNVVTELKKDKRRRFCWSETSYFARWWGDQNESVKQSFRNLVKAGQVEFINSGWVQQDEANPDLSASINQMTVGHQWIWEQFGVRPNIAWQIDPFGHSSMMPSLFALMGFDAVVLNRIPQFTKNGFKSKQHMEFLWEGDNVGSNQTRILAHVLHTHYSAPKGFDWEEGSPAISPSNVATRAAALLRNLKARSEAYRSNQLLVPWGDDFKFQNANRQFSNMDQIIAEINKNPGKYDNTKIFYSTPGMYFKALKQQNVQFPVHSGDFFTYADNADSFWSGYFTTRPFMKAISRSLETKRRSAEILNAIVRPKDEYAGQLDDIRKQAALFLHHDAITGTCKRHVMMDYMQRMADAATKASKITREILSKALAINDVPPPPLSPSYRLVANSQKVYSFVMFNNLAWLRTEIVSVKSSSPYVTVYNPEYKEITAQVDPFWDPKENEPSSKLWMVHFVAEVPPIGSSTYFVRVGSTSAQQGEKTTLATVDVYSHHKVNDRKRGGGQGDSPHVTTYHQFDSEQSIYLENKALKVYISPDNGLVHLIKDKATSTVQGFNQNFHVYKSSRGGAYLFRPTKKVPVMPGSTLTVRIFKGPVLESVSSMYATYEISGRLAKSEDPWLGNHFEQLLDVNVKVNENLVLNVDTRSPHGVLATNNGLQFRRRDEHKTHDHGLASKFYPMVLGARMVFDSANRNVTIMNKHTMAVGAPTDGNVEMLIHRSLGQDDGRGMGEAASDQSRAKVNLWITVDSKVDEDLDFKLRSHRLNNPVSLLAGPTYTIGSNTVTPPSVPPSYVPVSVEPARPGSRQNAVGEAPPEVTMVPPPPSKTSSPKSTPAPTTPGGNVKTVPSTGAPSQGVGEGSDLGSWMEFLKKYNPGLPAKRVERAAKALNDNEADKGDIPHLSTDSVLREMGITKWRTRKDIVDAVREYAKQTNTPIASRRLLQAVGDEGDLDIPITHKNKWTPIGEDGFPDDVHLLSFFTLGNKKHHVVLRLQSLMAATALDGDANMMFIEDMQLKAVDLHEMSLSVNADVGVGKYVPVRVDWRVGASDEDVEQYKSNAPDFLESNQNTDEEGVFISQAALDALKAKNNNHRRLLSADAEGDIIEDELESVYMYPPLSTHSVGEVTAPLSGRRLLADPDVAAAAHDHAHGPTEFKLDNYQIKTFVFRLLDNDADPTVSAVGPLEAVEIRRDTRVSDTRYRVYVLGFVATTIVALFLMAKRLKLRSAAARNTRD